jgi:hypothetical protein
MNLLADEYFIMRGFHNILRKRVQPVNPAGCAVGFKQMAECLQRRLGDAREQIGACLKPDALDNWQAGPSAGNRPGGTYLSE